jgi:DNA-binding MurR/RpiR family transcriptional regulator
MPLMDHHSLGARLSEQLDTLPKRLLVAARWVLDHPADVALLSTREQAKRAALAPATLTRLAQRIGLAGYDDLRAVYAASLRRRPESFSGRATELLDRHDEEGGTALAQDILAALGDHLNHLRQPEQLQSLHRAAERLASARTIFCFGLRSAFPAAYMLDFVRSLIGAESVLADGAGGRGTDVLRRCGTDDVVFAVSVAPYTRLTVQAAEYARLRGAAVVALTDSAHSPLALLADEVIVVRTETPSFFHSMTPAFAAVECLGALMTARKGQAALDAIKAAEAQADAFATYVTTRQRRGQT